MILTKENMVDKFLISNDCSLFDYTDDMYKELIGQSLIEDNKLEDFVMECITKKMQKGEIVQALKDKAPGIDFTIPDVNRFFARNRKLAENLFKKKEELVERHESAREKLVEKFADLSKETETLLQKWKSDDNPQAILGAINMLNKTWMNAATIMGLLDKVEDQNVSTIKIITDKKQKLVDRLHRADFIIDVETNE